MDKEEIAYTALDNIEPTLGISGEWAGNENFDRIDGRLLLHVENRELAFGTIVREELRTHSVNQIIDEYNDRNELVVIAWRLYPVLKEKLREHGVNYLEANGNLFINSGDVKIFLDTNKKLKDKKAGTNKAYTPAGLKVVFALLKDKKLIDQPQREIAKRANVALGNIPKVLNDLQNMGHLYKLNKKRLVFNDRKELLDIWAREYHNTLKPTLSIGQFVNRKYENWKEIPLNTRQTVWGGEPAADLLTNYLRPGQLTLYTVENNRELMLNYGFKPSSEGNIHAYRKFWYQDSNKATAPAILVYADLINANDKRCLETANKLFNDYIEPELQGS